MVMITMVVVVVMDSMLATAVGLKPHLQLHFHLPRQIHLPLHPRAAAKAALQPYVRRCGQRDGPSVAVELLALPFHHV